MNQEQILQQPVCDFCNLRMALAERKVIIYKKTMHRDCYTKYLANLAEGKEKQLLHHPV